MKSPNVLWTFGFLFVVLQSQTNGLEFGVCERIVSRQMMNTSVMPPIHYKVNETIHECCFGFMKMHGKCVPMCQNVCVNSHCIGNNKCQCNPGYYPVDHYRCLPKCDPPCGNNMACLAPDKCFCKQGYKASNESQCEPICSFTADNFECINAKCVAPDECECFSQHRKVSDFQCEPICLDCVNGECSSPGVCECHDGFEKGSNGRCEPVCDPPCINGVCEAPNSCKCNDNFEKYLSNHECLGRHVIKDRQSCIESCLHGTCSDNGTCICDPDYEMFNGKCLKICQKECRNGKCLEDQCVCPDGYRLSENFTVCLPICAFEDGHDCIYGACVAPQTCQCFEGYKFLDARNCTCVPMCNPRCINGICTENGCICHENFYNISEFECVKTCSEGFKWVYDDCIEDIPFEPIETDEEFTPTTEIFTSEEDLFSTITFEPITSYEDTSSSELNITEDDDDYDKDESEDDSNEDEEDNDEGSGKTHEDYSKNITSEETLVVKSLIPRMLPMKPVIIIVSVIVILITSILIMFCLLYLRLNQKNIYHVHEQEISSNSVYFTRKSDPTTLPEIWPETECSL